MIVRSFIQDMPGPMAALRPAVPNSILEEKHFFRASTAPSFIRSCTMDTVLGFWGGRTQKNKHTVRDQDGYSILFSNATTTKPVRRVGKMALSFTDD